MALKNLPLISIIWVIIFGLVAAVLGIIAASQASKGNRGWAWVAGIFAIIFGVLAVGNLILALISYTLLSSASEAGSFIAQNPQLLSLLAFV